MTDILGFVKRLGIEVHDSDYDLFDEARIVAITGELEMLRCQNQELQESNRKLEVDIQEKEKRMESLVAGVDGKVDPRTVELLVRLMRQPTGSLKLSGVRKSRQLRQCQDPEYLYNAYCTRAYLAHTPPVYRLAYLLLAGRLQCKSAADPVKMLALLESHFGEDIIFASLDEAFLSSLQPANIDEAAKLLHGTPLKARTTRAGKILAGLRWGRAPVTPSR